VAETDCSATGETTTGEAVGLCATAQEPKTGVQNPKNKQENIAIRGVRSHVARDSSDKLVFKNWAGFSLR